MNARVKLIVAASVLAGFMAFHAEPAEAQTDPASEIRDLLVQLVLAARAGGDTAAIEAELQSAFSSARDQGLGLDAILPDDTRGFLEDEGVISPN